MFWYMTNYGKRHYQKYGKKVIKRVLIRVRKIRDTITEYKKTQRCKDCGINDYRVLDFDHLPEHKKFKEVALMITNGYSLERIFEEINKCEVVCSNCHRIRTFERKKNISR